MFGSLGSTDAVRAMTRVGEASALRPVSFHVGDCRTFRVAAVPGLIDSFPDQFDIVLLQLLISIVGAPQDRVRLLENAFAQTTTGGFLLMSASADSARVNDEYKKLYAEASLITRELRTVCRLHQMLDRRGSCYYVNAFNCQPC